MDARTQPTQEGLVSSLRVVERFLINMPEGFPVPHVAKAGKGADQHSLTGKEDPSDVQVEQFVGDEPNPIRLHPSVQGKEKKCLGDRHGTLEL